MAADGRKKFVTVKPIMNTRGTKKKEKGQRTRREEDSNGSIQLVREVETGRNPNARQ